MRIKVRAEEKSEEGRLDVVSPQCAYVRRASRPNYAQSSTTDVNANCTHVQSVTSLNNILFYHLSGMNCCTSRIKVEKSK